MQWRKTKQQTEDNHGARNSSSQAKDKWEGIQACDGVHARPVRQNHSLRVVSHGDSEAGRASPQQDPPSPACDTSRSVMEVL
jgi:hypothetical protein